MKFAIRKLLDTILVLDYIDPETELTEDAKGEMHGGFEERIPFVVINPNIITKVKNQHLIWTIFPASQDALCDPLDIIKAPGLSSDIKGVSPHGFDAANLSDLQEKVCSFFRTNGVVNTIVMSRVYSESSGGLPNFWKFCENKGLDYDLNVKRDDIFRILCEGVKEGEKIE